MVIYGDVLLAVNWWIDYLLLLAVRRMTGGVGRGWRLALGALVGALSCLVLFLPPLPVVLSLLIKLPAAALMVAVAFPFAGWRAFFRQLLALFGLSAGLAGACGALYFFVAPTGLTVFNGVVYYGVPPLLLVGLTVLFYGLLWLAERVMGRRAPANCRFVATLEHEGRQVRFSCLYDSGNHLVEPFSGWPVLVVERGMLEEVLAVPAGIAQMEDTQGWRVIPFSSVGGEGLLPAFVPDRVTLRPLGGRVPEKPLPPCYIAVCDHLGRGEYRGLMSSAFGEEWMATTE